MGLRYFSSREFNSEYAWRVSVWAGMREAVIWIASSAYLLLSSRAVISPNRGRLVYWVTGFGLFVFIETTVIWDFRGMLFRLRTR